MGDRGSVPFAATTLAFGVYSLLAFVLVHVDGTAPWWAAAAWISGLFAFIGGLAAVGSRWVGDPWWLSQWLGATGAGLAGLTGLLAFVVFAMQPTSSY
jgi:hypothetical protein